MLAKALSAATAAAAAPTYVEDVFSTWLYTGNDSTQTITNGIDLAGNGGLVWLKGRSSAISNYLYNTVNGGGSYLSSNSTGGLANTGTTVVSFASTGFSLPNGNVSGENASGVTYASWTFRKAAKFFDVVTYTGNGTNRTIAHNLGSVPGCIIVKRTDTTGDWQVYHRSLANTEYLVLNSTAAKATGATRWNSTTPTSTEFSLGTDATVNANGGTYVAYLFAHDASGFGDSGNQSVVKCGSFTTDGSGNATVDLGWEPQWLLTKLATDSPGNMGNANWIICDNMRGFTASDYPNVLQAESSSSEYQRGIYINPNSSGFRYNQGYSNQTYIYIAIRRGPMKTPTDATKVFSMVDRAGTSATATVAGFTNLIDTLIVRGKVNGFPANFYDRLRGATKILFSNSTGSETTDANTLTGFDVQTGYTVGGDNSGYGINYASGGPYINWAFRRAPGFFDVVAYTGGGFVNESISHNLGVKPELVIIKRRNASELWWVNAVFGSSTFQQGSLDTTDQFASTTYSVQGFGNPTSSALVFNSVGSGGHASGGTYIAYLFASCPGVSKVGNYTGTGTTQQINCGFTAGARFVLIKRTDSTGDWYVWDTARGIISGNDPYLLLNSSAAEVTNTDYIDPLNSGFEISSTAPAAINANGGSFIFLAVA